MNPLRVQVLSDLRLIEGGLLLLSHEFSVLITLTTDLLYYKITLLNPDSLRQLA